MLLLMFALYGYIQVQGFSFDDSKIKDSFHGNALGIESMVQESNVNGMAIFPLMRSFIEL